MRLLLDTDVILDLMLDRPGFADAAAVLWQANAEKRLEAVRLSYHASQCLLYRAQT